MTFPFSALPQERLLRWLPGGAIVLLAILIGLQAARLFWLLVPDDETSAWTPRPAVAAAPGPSAQQQLDIAGLLAAQLFGVAQQEASSDLSSDVVDAPDTNLRLTLRGIFASDDFNEESRALIEPANGELAAYAIGDTVPGGAKLHSVLADRVLLERAGRLETLRLERDAPTSGAAAQAREQLNRSVAASDADRVIDAKTAAELSTIRTELLNDPSKASDYLRVQPAQRNGQLRGYRIYPGRKRELFRSAGLRPGDLVTAINGVQLNDPSSSLGVLGDLSQSSQINLTIERGGRPQTISVTLN